MSPIVNGPGPDLLDLSENTPGELRRRMRHASTLLAAAELPIGAGDREAVLRRVRGHLAGTLDKLDSLIASVRNVPTAAVADPLTERHEPDRIEPFR